MGQSFLQLGQVDELAGQAVDGQRGGRPLGRQTLEFYGMDDGAKVDTRLTLDALGGQAAVVDPLQLAGPL